jgi:hypothetical protein
MRKLMTVAVLAFVAGAATTWTLERSGAVPRTKTANIVKTIDVMELTMKAGAMPTQQFDAH